MPEWPEQNAPIQLVTFDSGSKGPPQLVVEEDARRALLKAAGTSPVRAIAVCGVYRTGKSFLLNLLADSQGKGEFVVGDTVRACTAGLWVRTSKPSAKDGSVCLLIDCEGSGNTERDREHDARLFALAVLLSSLLIFNSRGVISDTAVQALALAASLAQHIHRQHKKLASGMRLSPAFLWVLRDFALALEDTSGNPITSRDYLEQMLGRYSAVGQPAPGVADVANWAEKREAREKILELFTERDCATLVRPVDDEEDLQRLAQLPVDQLRPKFMSQITELRSKVFRGCPVLTSPTGEVATGGAFLALLEAHVEAMNKGNVPDLGNTWHHVQRQECARGVEEGVRAFSSATLDVASSLPVPPDDLQEVLARARAVAYQKFREVAIGDEATRNEHEKELNDSIDETTARLVKENESVAVRQNEAWLQQRWASHVEEPLKKYRLQYDADELDLEEVEEAEAALTEHIAELDSAYFQEAVGSKEAYEEPYQRIIGRRKDAAFREIAAWRSRRQATIDAKAAASKAAQEDRARLAREGDALARKAEREAEESKARMAARNQAKQGGKKGAGQAGKQPKCCAVQ